MMSLLGGNTRPSNTVKVALCALFSVMMIAVAIVGLSVAGGSSPGALTGIEALKDIGVGLTGLGSAATLAKGGRDAARDISQGWTPRPAPPPRYPLPYEDPPAAVPGPRRPGGRTSDEVPLPDEEGA